MLFTDDKGLERRNEGINKEPLTENFHEKLPHGPALPYGILWDGINHYADLKDDQTHPTRPNLSKYLNNRLRT